MKKPFNPKWFMLWAFLFSFLCAGVLAGINWKRLGQPEKKMKTILLSIVGFVIFIVALVYLPDALGRVVGIAVNLGVGYAFRQAQINLYGEWIQRNNTVPA